MRGRSAGSRPPRSGERGVTRRGPGRGCTWQPTLPSHVSVWLGGHQVPLDAQKAGGGSGNVGRNDPPTPRLTGQVWTEVRGQARGSRLQGPRGLVQRPLLGRPAGLAGAWAWAPGAAVAAALPAWDLTGSRGSLVGRSCQGNLVGGGVPRLFPVSQPRAQGQSAPGTRQLVCELTSHARGLGPRPDRLLEADSGDRTLLPKSARRACCRPPRGEV